MAADRGRRARSRALGHGHWPSIGRPIGRTVCLCAASLVAACETASESTAETVDCDFTDYKVTGPFRGAVCGEGGAEDCRFLLVTARSDPAPAEAGRRLIKWRMPQYLDDVTRFDAEEGTCWLLRGDFEKRRVAGSFYTVDAEGFSTVEIQPDYLTFRCEPTPNTRYLFSRNLPEYAVCADPFEERG